MPESARREQVLTLRAQGLSLSEIATELGLSYSWVGHLASAKAYETTIRQSREAKTRRTGHCADCGAVTHYNGVDVAARCLPCANKITAQARLGHGKTVEALLAFLTEPRRYSEISKGLGISHSRTSVLLDRHLKTGLIVRLRRGVYARP